MKNLEVEVKPCNRCNTDPISMGGSACFVDGRGYALMCPVCKRSSGYFASEEDATKAWNEMNTSAP